jgi:hypothetical protein
MELIVLQSHELQAFKLEILDEIKALINNQPAKTTKVEYYDIPQTCELLKVSKRSLQNYRDKGIIAFSQINHKIFFSSTDIECFIEKTHKKTFNRKYA